MIEFLVASAQALCLFALLYGAYLVISRGPQMAPVPARKARRGAARADGRAMSQVAGEHERD